VVRGAGKEKAMRTYRLRGILYGRIWMPAQECWKSFDTGEFSFTDKDTYCPPRNGFPGEYPDWRTVLCDVTNDGDFQCAAILEAVLTVTDYKRTRKIQRTIELTGRNRHDRDCWVKGGPAKRRAILDKISMEYA
jgi:hypothetical protein